MAKSPLNGLKIRSKTRIMTTVNKKYVQSIMIDDGSVKAHIFVNYRFEYEDVSKAFTTKICALGMEDGGVSFGGCCC